jgi:general stress protein 26
MENTDLKNQAAIDKIKALVKAIDICLFCTNLRDNDGLTTRPMSTQDVDEYGNLWFFSAKDSTKNEEITKDSKVQLFYSHPSKSSYMILNGATEISFDKDKIKQYWSPLAKTWFKEGIDDPNISLIKVNTKSAYYWDVEGNQMVNFFKMIASVATGTNLVDAKAGNLEV